MASSVEELVDILFNMVEDAKKVPVIGGDRCMLDRDQVLDLLDEIKAQFPMELVEAQRVLATKAERIEAAEREAEIILKKAEERAKRLVSEDEMLKQARHFANEITKQGEERSRELRRGAYEYCEDTLNRTEEAISEAYEEIKRARSRFRAAASQQQQHQSSGRSVYNAEDDER